jgi:hypothetical protein
MLVPHLERDLAGVAVRQPVPPDLSRRAGGLMLGSIQAIELQTLFIGSEVRSLPDMEQQRSM